MSPPIEKLDNARKRATKNMFEVMDAVVPERKAVKTTSDPKPYFPADTLAKSKHPAVVSFRQSTTDKVRAKAANLKKTGPPQPK
jgi:hypothetical protein